MTENLSGFVDKEKGFGSLAVFSTFTPTGTLEELWVRFLFGAGSLLITQGINYARKIRRYQTEIEPLLEEFFLQRLEHRDRECIVGLRYGDRVSAWDNFGASRLFGMPLALRFADKLRRLMTRQPNLPQSNKAPINVGGWRPIREVERILRGKPFIFGIQEKSGKKYIPEAEELEMIRRQYDKSVSWIVCQMKAGRRKVWHEPKYRGDGTLKSDLAIITLTDNPDNINKGALAISGTHREGTLGAALLVSEWGWLKQFTSHQDVLKNCRGAKYQALIRLHFPSYSRENPNSLQLLGFEVLGVDPL